MYVCNLCAKVTSYQEYDAVKQHQRFYHLGLPNFDPSEPIKSSAEKMRDRPLMYGRWTY
jgi:hypothetical protein